ncbi:MAG: hypothetical protein NTX61_08295 [Bacteroidetes bacterium]|nr:hypothetical protein [Bacteroidota bacterium]
MEVLVRINTQKAQGRQYLKILKESPDFAQIVTSSNGKINPQTAEALNEIRQKKGKRYTSVKTLMEDLKK